MGQSMVERKRIGILGSGDAGKSLGSGFARHGWDVMVGTRDASKLKEWQAETNAKVGSFEDAAKHGEVVILALSGAGTVAGLDMAGPANFSGKLVLDATNPLDFSSGGMPGLFVGTSDSLGERVQRKLPDARVVKCFNTVGNSQMVDPKFKQAAPPMLICGNDEGAKKETEQILQSIGWTGATDIGGIDGARWLEALVPLWVRVAAPRNAWGHAFKSVE